MRLLGIETTGPYCSAAVLDGEKIKMRSNGEKLNHLSCLSPMIDELMKEGSYKLTDMDAIAVSAGPGSFTGIRIGVSTGRALCQVSGVPLISVPTLHAFGYSEAAVCDDEGKRIMVCPLFNARRGQVYAGAYSGFSRIVKGGPYMLVEFIDLALENMNGQDDPEKIIFIGDGVDAYADRIDEICAEKGFSDYEMKRKYQDAEGVCRMAEKMISLPGFEDRTGLAYNDLEPQYMRMTEAEQRLREGTLGKGIAGKGNS